MTASLHSRLQTMETFCQSKVRKLKYTKWLNAFEDIIRKRFINILQTVRHGKKENKQLFITNVNHRIWYKEYKESSYFYEDYSKLTQWNKIKYLLFVNLLPYFTQFVANQLSDVFDHHSILFKLSGSKQTKSLQKKEQQKL